MNEEFEIYEWGNANPIQTVTTTNTTTNGLLVPSYVDFHPPTNVTVLESDDGDPPPRFRSVDEADAWMEQRD